MDRLFLLRFNFRICGVIHGRLSLVFVLFFSMGSVFRGLEQHSKLGGGLPTFQFSSRLVTFSCSPSLLKRSTSLCMLCMPIRFRFSLSSSVHSVASKYTVYLIFIHNEFVFPILIKRRLLTSL